MTMASGQLPVLFIAGYGRSGSTILNMMLDQHPSLLGVGELSNLGPRVWPMNEYCSCQRRVHDCPFWSAVVQAFHQAFGPQALSRYAQLQSRYETLASMARLSLTGTAAKPEFREYAALTTGMFEALHKVSGKHCVIDCSKLPGRAMAISAMGNVDLKLVHLIRDGRGVAWSLAKPIARDLASGVERTLPARSTARTAARWSIVNLAAERVARRLGSGKSIRMRYEDLVTSPSTELARVGALLGIDLSTVASLIEAGEPLDPGHVVAGSRLRMKSSLRLSFDQEWRARMPPEQQRRFQLLGGWLQSRYGYR
jgi:hypothetical protein